MCYNRSTVSHNQLILYHIWSPAHNSDKVNCCRYGRLCLWFWRQICNNLNSTACHGRHCRQLGPLCRHYGRLCRPNVECPLDFVSSVYGRQRDTVNFVHVQQSRPRWIHLCRQWVPCFTLQHITRSMNSWRTYNGPFCGHLRPLNGINCKQNTSRFRYLGETEEKPNATDCLHRFIDIRGNLVPARITWTWIWYVHGNIFIRENDPGTARGDGVLTTRLHIDHQRYSLLKQHSTAGFVLNLKNKTAQLFADYVMKY